MNAYSTAMRPPPWMRIFFGTRPTPTMESLSKSQPAASSQGSDGSRVDDEPVATKTVGALRRSDAPSSAATSIS